MFVDQTEGNTTAICRHSVYLWRTYKGATDLQIDWNGRSKSVDGDELLDGVIFAENRTGARFRRPNPRAACSLPLSGRAPGISTSLGISSAGWAVTLPIGPCTPLAFSVSSRSSGCFGRINMRGFFCSPLEVVGKGLKLTRNRSVGHGLGSAKQNLCCF
jgi:hypothetical protein